MPILRTIHATGLFEGGSFCWLNEHTALAGLSYRQNEEGARQIEEVLAAQGARLHKIDLAGYAMHIDGQLVMVDQDLALINISRVPWRLLDTLKELKIKWVEVHHADNPRVANVLAVRPGKVSSPSTTATAPRSASSTTASRSCPSTTASARRTAGASTARRRRSSETATDATVGRPIPRAQFTASPRA
jgi:N-dimethylarginine dimethylaminohydrolase